MKQRNNSGAASAASLAPGMVRMRNGDVYQQLGSRLSDFRKAWPCGRVTTGVVQIRDGSAVMWARVECADADGNILAVGTGHAEGVRTEARPDFVEVAESAAIARALRFCGIGRDLGV